MRQLPTPLQSDFFFYQELQAALAAARFESCIIVHLNPILNKLLPKEGVKSKFPFAGGIACEQQEILEILANEDFDRNPMGYKMKKPETLPFLKMSPGMCR